MPILTSTIKPGNVYAKHSNGTIVIPSAVITVGQNYQYTIERDWQNSDRGIWEIFTSDTTAVLSQNGIAIAPQKIGEITVNIVGVAQYLVSVNFGNLSQVIRSEKTPDFKLDWEQWNQVTEDYTAWTITVCLWMRVGVDAAMPMVVRTEPLFLAIHSNATEISAGVFETRVSGGAKLTYRNARVRDFQNDIDTLEFPAGKYNNFTWNLLDANKVPLGTTGTNGGGVISPTLTSLNQGYTAIAPAAMFMRFTLTLTDGTGDVVYEFPLS